MKTEFLQPRFDGGRFEEHTLPLEVARDLAAYKDLVVALAKNIYLQQNPDRLRTPRGFAERFNLHIEKVDEGSARPMLVLVTTAMMAMSSFNGSGEIEYFMKARDRIAECISAGADGRPLPGDFPKHLLKYFDSIGCSLRKDESVDLAPWGNIKAVLTPKVRQTLVAAARLPILEEVDSNVVFERADLEGSIDETDWQKMSFRLRLLDESAVIVRFSDSLRDRVHAASGKARTQVQVKGIGVHDTSGQVQIVTEVVGLKVLPNQALAEQFEALVPLENGWLGESSKAPDRDGLTWVRDQFVGTFPEDIPFPAVAPTAEGGLFIEWASSSMRVSVEIPLPARNADLQVVNVDTGDSEDDALDLDAPDAWPALYEFVRRHL